MNLEYNDLCYIIIYLTGSIVALILAFETWGRPNQIKFRSSILAYIIVVMLSWLLVLVLATGVMETKHETKN